MEGSGSCLPAERAMSLKTDNSDTVSSVGSSREDFNELAASLGLGSAEQLAQDRFQVERQRLENLIFGNPENPDAAAQFFETIMQETGTHITWPSRLKMGAKSKKDPHVRVLGRIEDVRVAKAKILELLDTRGTRVIMKIDVSYTDHSHIIGRGGLSIKRVMEETGCHIHFPDSNRSNATEKSNQVSIAGEVGGVERARAKVRELTPLIFCFELPIIGSFMINQPDPSSPYIKSLQDTYNVQVMFRSRQRLNATLVVVKGCEWELAKVKEATQLLIQHMCEDLAGQVLVHVMLEISPQHHNIVLGRNHENLKGIMQRTSTQIVILDPNDPNIPSLKKSNVTITGSINNVYIARQQLIGSLPVAIMFDVPSNCVLMGQDQITDLMTTLDVVISTRNKPKKDIISFIIKGIERNVANIYEARRQLIAPNDPPISVNIPSTYLIPNGGITFRTVWQQAGESFYNNLPSPIVVTPLLNRVPENMWSNGQPHYHLLPHQWSNIVPHNYHGNHLGHFSFSSLSLPELPAYSSLSSNASSLSNSASPRTVSPVPQNTECSKSDIYPSFNDFQKEENTNNFEHSGLMPAEYKQLKLQAISAIRKHPNEKELRVPTSAWSGYGFSQSSPTASVKEMKMKDEESFSQIDQEGWFSSNQEFKPSLGDFSNGMNGGVGIPLSSSNYLESLTDRTALGYQSESDPPDMISILTSSGLEKYIQLFKYHEIDLGTFRTLTETDLKEIGVTPFGARRKLLFCIAELNRKYKVQFRGSAAPGAERKTSTSNLVRNGNSDGIV